MLIKRFLHCIFFCAVLFCLFSFSAFAKEESLALSVSRNYSKVADRNENTYAELEEITLESEKSVGSLYLVFYDTPTDFELKTELGSITLQGEYLRQFVDVRYYFEGDFQSLTLNFEKKTRLLEIYAFDETVPSWVQRWEDNDKKADLCLFSTHSDDEHLFFAGILPYYAGEMDYEVQVIYFADHRLRPLRRHELLCGLWTVGVTRYPVIGPFLDRYSESEDDALRQLQSDGYTKEDAVGFQVEMLRRFQPLVAVGHDPEGEYGHGQHRLNSSTLREAVERSGDPDEFEESALTYGVWDTPKTYLHLYGENTIRLDWDKPLETFEGKTAFQVSQDGFACHVSQHSAWFLPWLMGSEKASEIKTYSPCEFGLYRSLVGEDAAKNDFFENLKSRGEELEERLRLQFAKAEEKRRLEEEEARLEAEKRQKAEEERRKKEEADRLEKEMQEALKRKRILLVMFSSLLFAFGFSLAVFLVKKKKRA